MSVYTGVLERAASTITSASAGLFAALSAVRRKRFFHPHGETFEGSLTFISSSFDLPFSGQTQALVRLSRGAGLPGSLPDVWGLAVKVPEFGHDFLFATSGSGRVTRHLLLPSSNLFNLPYSSVLPYELGDNLIVFGARVDSDLKQAGAAGIDEVSALVAAGKLRFDLTVAEVGSRGHETFGSLVVDRVHHGDLEFNPWRCTPPLRPAGPLNRLRRDTYEASQEARPDNESSDGTRSLHHEKE